jgi:hypothetical protein
MRIRLLLALLVVSTFAFAAGPADNDRAALLKLHAADRDGHLKGDADLLTAPLAANFIEVVGGHAQQMSREDAKQKFLQYLKTVKFTMWDDAADPQITISSDGKLAFMIVQIKAEVAAIDNPESKRDFSDSAIETFEKGSNGWQMTAIAATAGK